MTYSTKEIIYSYISHLVCWLEINGWAGWDPYDIWDNQIGLWIAERDNFAQRVANYLVSRSNDLFPIALRRVLKVKKCVNAKAMGLFAAGFLILERVDAKNRTIKKESGYNPCFRWLNDHKVVRYGGCGWGYPFNWRTRVLIPRNTPTVVNSTIIGDAYWLKYKYHGDEEALSQCENICKFILEGLNRSGHKSDGTFCFSYTPLDKFQVHNANLFAAEFLIRIGKEIKRDAWVETGMSAGDFSLSEIREDGTLNYWSNEQSRDLHQDTYHSGFEIRALNSIAILTGTLKYRKAADNYFNTWLRDFFSEDGVPCFIRKQFDVVEVHSCAESLLCTARMFEADVLAKELFFHRIKKILSAISDLWVINSSENGYFASKKRKLLGFDITIDIPYIRWGQAWMFNSLATILNFIKPEHRGL